MSTYPTLTVNGVSLNDASGRWAMAPDQQLRGLPGRRSTSVAVPGLSGVLYPGRDPRDVAQFSISMLVLGRGAGIDERIADLESSLDALAFLFSQDSVSVLYNSSVLQSYQADCRLISASTPIRVGICDATITYMLEIPSSYWRSPDYGQLNVAGAAAVTNATIEVTPLNGTIAPITDCEFLIGGPATRWQINAYGGGQSIRCDTAVPAGRWLNINCGTFTAVLLTVPSWNVAGGVDWTGLINAFGQNSATSWLSLTALPHGNDPADRRVNVGVNYIDPTSVSEFRIRARKAY